VCDEYSDLKVLMSSLYGTVLAEGAAVAIMAFSFSLLLRGAGVFILEAAVFANAVALALFAYVVPQGTAGPDTVRFVMGGSIALVAGLCMGAMAYRPGRGVVGGEATALAMSFTAMLFWSLVCGRLTDYKPVAIGVGNLRLLTIVGWLTLGAIYAALSVPRLNAAVKFSRDNEDLLSTFSIHPRLALAWCAATSFVLLVMGTTLYLAVQRNFELRQFSGFLIPVFGIAIVTPRLGVAHITGFSLLLVLSEQYLRVTYGEMLLPVFQGAVLALFSVVLPTLRLAADELYARVNRMRHVRIVVAGEA
jgi:hypothetical protein